jgi:hypothetical protein
MARLPAAFLRGKSLRPFLRVGKINSGSRCGGLRERLFWVRPVKSSEYGDIDIVSIIRIRPREIGRLATYL